MQMLPPGHQTPALAGWNVGLSCKLRGPQGPAIAQRCPDVTLSRSYQPANIKDEHSVDEGLDGRSFRDRNLTLGIPVPGLAVNSVRMLQQNVRVGTNRSRDGEILSHVKPTLSEFKFRDECLPLADTPPEFDLRNTCVLSSLDKQLNHSAIEVGLG